MFNKTVIESGPRTITKTVHEHRAPTDDSVKLLREMEQSASDEIIKKFRVQDNVIKDAVVVVSKNPVTTDVHAGIVFTINGNRYSKRILLYGDFTALEVDHLQTEVQRVFADAVVGLLYPHLVAGMLRKT